jgi:hypothetical protein
MGTSSDSSMQPQTTTTTSSTSSHQDMPNTSTSSSNNWVGPETNKKSHYHNEWTTPDAAPQLNDDLVNVQALGLMNLKVVPLNQY